MREILNWKLRIEKREAPSLCLFCEKFGIRQELFLYQINDKVAHWQCPRFCGFPLISNEPVDKYYCDRDLYAEDIPESPPFPYPESGWPPCQPPLLHVEEKELDKSVVASLNTPVYVHDHLLDISKDVLVPNTKSSAGASPKMQSPQPAQSHSAISPNQPDPSHEDAACSIHEDHRQPSIPSAQPDTDDDEMLDVEERVEVTEKSSDKEATIESSSLLSHHSKQTPATSEKTPVAFPSPDSEPAGEKSRTQSQKTESKSCASNIHEEETEEPKELPKIDRSLNLPDDPFVEKRYRADSRLRGTWMKRFRKEWNCVAKLPIHSVVAKYMLDNYEVKDFPDACKGKGVKDDSSPSLKKLIHTVRNWNRAGPSKDSPDASEDVSVPVLAEQEQSSAHEDQAETTETTVVEEVKTAQVNAAQTPSSDIPPTPSRDIPPSTSSDIPPSEKVTTDKLDDSQALNSSHETIATVRTLRNRTVAAGFTPNPRKRRFSSPKALLSPTKPNAEARNANLDKTKEVEVDVAADTAAAGTAAVCSAGGVVTAAKIQRLASNESEKKMELHLTMSSSSESAESVDKSGAESAGKSGSESAGKSGSELAGKSGFDHFHDALAQMNLPSKTSAESNSVELKKKRFDAKDLPPWRPKNRTNVTHKPKNQQYCTEKILEGYAKLKDKHPSLKNKKLEEMLQWNIKLDFKNKLPIGNANKDRSGDSIVKLNATGTPVEFEKTMQKRATPTSAAVLSKTAGKNKKFAPFSRAKPNSGAQSASSHFASAVQTDAEKALDLQILSKHKHILDGQKQRDASNVTQYVMQQQMHMQQYALQQHVQQQPAQPVDPFVSSTVPMSTATDAMQYAMDPFAPLVENVPSTSGLGHVDQSYGLPGSLVTPSASFDTQHVPLMNPYNAYGLGLDSTYSHEDMLMPPQEQSHAYADFFDI